MVLINRGVFLKNIYLQEGSTETYPYNIPAFRGLAKIELTTAVTFLVGENGSGKSTLLEGLILKGAVVIIVLRRLKARRD